MKKPVIFFLFLFFYVSGYNQSKLRWYSWISADISKPLFNDKLAIEFSSQVRIDQLKFIYSSSLHELSASYDVNRYFGLTAGYRFTLSGGHFVDNRFFIKLNTTLPIGNFKIQYNTQLQSDLNNYLPANYVYRNKFGVKYRISEIWVVYIEDEIFYNFTFNFHKFTSNRIGAGIEYYFKKHHRLKGSIMNNMGFNTPEPRKDITISIGYKYTF